MILKQPVKSRAVRITFKGKMRGKLPPDSYYFCPCVQQEGNFCANEKVISVPTGRNGKSGVPPKDDRLFRKIFPIDLGVSFTDVSTG